MTVTLFCRAETRRWHLLLTEQNAHQAGQLSWDDFFQFSEQYSSSPSLSLGERTFRVTADDVEFQRISRDHILLSLYLPRNLAEFADQTLAFDPDFARVFNDLLRTSVDFPTAEWMSVTESNCI